MLTLGTSIEWRNKPDLCQASCCYTDTVVTKGGTRPTHEERSRGFRVIWFPTIDAALAAPTTVITEEEQRAFIKRRGLALLERARAMMHTSLHA